MSILSLTIDDEGVITTVGPNWDAGVLAWGLRNLTGSRVVGTSLLDHLRHSTHRQLLRQLISEARVEQQPALIWARWHDQALPLTLHRGGDDRLDMTLDPDHPRALPNAEGRPAFVLMCSACRKIRIGDDWMSATDAVAKEDLLIRDPVPVLSHGLCSTCYPDAPA